MSTAVIWILFPALVAAILLFLRRRMRAVLLAGVIVSLALAWLAWKLPIGQPLIIGTWRAPFELSDTLSILGRRFTIGTSSRPYLMMIYLTLAFWFGGANQARTGQLFIPLGLAMGAILTAALAVEPFLYAALLIEMAVLISVPLLSPPGQPAGRGVLRYLTFQTLGMPFILFTGWMLGGTQANPVDAQAVARVSVMMVLGFAFLAAIFPFHTWIPMLAEEVHPYAAAFVFFLLPGVVSLFGLEFFYRFTWLQQESAAYAILRLLGTLMVVTGGLWAAFQRNLGRMLGYAVTVEIGLSLLAISLGFGAPGSPPAGAAVESPPLSGIFFALLLPRGLGLALWAYALALLRPKVNDLNFRNVQGIARRMPFTASSLILADFSIAGLPLLAGFPAHMALWSAISSQSLLAALLSILGSAGLLFGGMRSLAALVMGPGSDNWQISESWGQIILLSLGGLAIILLGLLPQLYIPALVRIASLLGSPSP